MPKQKLLNMRYVCMYQVRMDIETEAPWNKQMVPCLFGGDGWKGYGNLSSPQQTLSNSSNYCIYYLFDHYRQCEMKILNIEILTSLVEWTVIKWLESIC